MKVELRSGKRSMLLLVSSHRDLFASLNVDLQRGRLHGKNEIHTPGRRKPDVELIPFRDREEIRSVSTEK